MHLRGLDLNLLVVLDVLLKEQSITQAAKRLNLSQSGTSTALARLREFFGDELLTLIERRMVLTPLAQTLIEPVRTIIMQAQNIIDATPGFSPKTSDRRFIIMASDYIATIFLPKVVEDVMMRAPGIVIEAIPFATVAFEPLVHGEIDLLIMPEQYLSPEHPSMPLFTDEYVCVSCQANPLVGETLDLDTYLNLGHVIARFGKDRGMAFDEWFTERFDRPRRVESIVQNFAMLPHYVVGTQRLATMHSRLAKTYAQFLPLRVHQLPFDMPLITEAVQWNRFSDRNPALTWLRGVMSEVASRLQLGSVL